jgi:threonine dehydrogenase-like Zn-dependent dehydrogenase
VNAKHQDVIEAVEEITRGGLADIAVEAVGIEETTNQRVYLVKKFGLVVPFGVPKQGTFRLHYKRFLRRQLRAIASDRTGDEPGYLSFKLAADYVAQGRIDLSPP